MAYEASDNSRYSEIIKEKLGLEREPVAVKFVKTEEDIPQGIEKVAKKARHCEFVTQAAAGDIFYASAQEQACKGGSSAMGLEPRPPKVESGEFYFGLGRFDSVETSKKVVDSLPKVDEENFALLYAPLKDADFVPDTLIIIANPIAGMKTAQAIVYNTGERAQANFAGIQSLCADAVAGTYTTGKPNATLGCDGSRGYAGIKEDEIIYALAKDNIEPFISAFENL